MKHLSIKQSIATPLTLCLLLSTPLFAAAQTSVSNGPPKILVIDREFLKPGKSGALHEKSESAFVRAAAAAKSKSYYFGMDSMTGASRSLFFFPYDSFEAWEKDNLTNRKNATLSAALDHAFNADGELLSSYEQSAFAFRPDLSLNTGPLTGKRYMEITQIIVKPGHTADAEDIARIYLDGYKKIAPSFNWAAFQLVYGAGTGDAFLFITTYKSLSEADQGLTALGRFMDQLGDRGRKRFSELSTGMESISTNLFELNPKISYPPEEFIKAEPDFWKPKPAAPTKKPEPAATN